MSNNNNKPTQQAQKPAEQQKNEAQKSVKVKFIKRYIGTLGNYSVGNVAEISAKNAENLIKFGLVEKC